MSGKLDWWYGLFVWETWLVLWLLFGRLDCGSGLTVGAVWMLTLLIFDMVNYYLVNRCPVNRWIMKWWNCWTQWIRKLWTGIESVICDAANRLCLRNGCRKLTENCSAGAVWSCETVRSLESESVDRDREVNRWGSESLLKMSHCKSGSLTGWLIGATGLHQILNSGVFVHVLCG